MFPCEFHDTKEDDSDENSGRESMRTKDIFCLTPFSRLKILEKEREKRRKTIKEQKEEQNNDDDDEDITNEDKENEEDIIQQDKQ